MILPFTKANKAGEKITYWTHSSYLDEQQLQKIESDYASRSTYRNYLALLGGIVGLKVIPLIFSLQLSLLLVN